MSAIEEIQQQILTNPKIAAGVSASTAGTGAVTYLELIPIVVGILTALASTTLACVLTYTHLKKFKVEMVILKEKESERLDRAAYRKKHGEPVRREDDTN